MQKITDNKLHWVERLSYLMDEKFRIPGTNFRFGLDPILNLIPVTGDLSGFLISVALVLTMAKHGASRKVVILMTLNILVDFIIGAIPILGQIFDFFFKANTRNIRLLKAHYEYGKHQGSGSGIIAMVVFMLIAFLLLLVWIIWNLIEWLIGLNLK